MRVFWDISSFSLARVYRRSRRAYCVHHKNDSSLYPRILSSSYSTPWESQISLLLEFPTITGGSFYFSYFIFSAALPSIITSNIKSNYLQRRYAATLVQSKATWLWPTSVILHWRTLECSSTVSVSVTEKIKPKVLEKHIGVLQYRSMTNSLTQHTITNENNRRIEIGLSL
jgi:hypothetical protein